MAEPEGVKTNDVHQKQIGEFQEKIATLRKDLRSKFNNRECALAATKLQEAEHWLEAYKAELKLAN